MTKELNNPISIIARSGQKARGVQQLKKISGIPSFLRRDLSKNPDASRFFIVGECRAKAQRAQKKQKFSGNFGLRTLDRQRGERRGAFYVKAKVMPQL